MAGEFLFIAGIIFVGVIVGFVIVLLKTQHDRKEPMDYTIVDNFMPQYANGHSQGMLINIDKGEERDGIEFIPKDIDYMRKLKMKEKIKIKPETVYVPHDKVIFLPRGTLSGERNRLWILPPKAESLPKTLREHPFGKVLVKMIEQINAEDNVIRVQRKRLEVENILLNKTTGGDRMREYLQLDKALNKDIIKKMLDFQKDKKTGPYSPPYPPRD